jgi:hypothetical protein
MWEAVAFLPQWVYMDWTVSHMAIWWAVGGRILLVGALVVKADTVAIA